MSHSEIEAARKFAVAKNCLGPLLQRCCSNCGLTWTRSCNQNRFPIFYFVNATTCVYLCDFCESNDFRASVLPSICCSVATSILVQAWQEKFAGRSDVLDVS